MQTSTLMASVLSAWSMAVAYDRIEVATGIAIRPLLYIAIIVMAAGLYFGCQGRKETTKEES